MDTGSLCQLCLLIVIFFLGVTDSQSIHVCTSENGQQCNIHCETTDQASFISFTHPHYGLAGGCTSSGLCGSSLDLGYTVARINSTFTRLTIPSLNCTTDRGDWSCSYGSSTSSSVLLSCLSNGQNARITAPDRFILNTERIQIDCQPAGSLYSQINALTILKNNQPMVNVGIQNGQSTIAWQDSSVQSRATTNNPDLSVVSSSELRVIIEATNTQCNDEAVYTCRVNGLDSGFNAVPNNEVSHNVTVVVKPDRMNDMQISPLPSAEGQYSKGEIITLSCTGTVGAYTDPPNITWCIQRSGEFNPTDLETDNNFRSFSQSNAQSVGFSPTTSCQFERTSTVVYQVANIDTDTTFFCQITAPGDSGICGQGTARQQKSIEVAPTTQPTGTGIGAPTTQPTGSGFGAPTTQPTGSGFGAPTTQPTGSGFGGTDNTNIGLLIGAIIGGVISITLAVILVIVVIYVIYRRKHNKTEKAAASNQYRQENMAYETLDSRVAISEVNVYNALSNTDNATGQHLQKDPTYDRLDGLQRDEERNTYQVLTDSRSNAQEMKTEYEIPKSYKRH